MVRVAALAAPEPGLLLLSLFIHISTCRGERVHFRVHAGDVVNQHTHTRTVLLHPSSEAAHQLRQLRHQAPHLPAGPSGYAMTTAVVRPGGPGPIGPKQPMSYIGQTLQFPMPTSALQNQQAQHPDASGPARHVPLPAMAAAAVAAGLMPGAVMLQVRGAGEPQKPRFSSKHTRTQVVTHQLDGAAGPLPTHMVLPSGAMVPVQLVALSPTPAQHRGRPGGRMSAALLAPPSTAELKKGAGCRAFISKGALDHADGGDCFLEEYENGYNEEQSKKTFFGDDKTDSKMEKGGARSSKRFRNESKFVHHPKIKNAWLPVRARTETAAPARVRSKPSSTRPVTELVGRVTMGRLPPAVHEEAVEDEDEAQVEDSDGEDGDTQKQRDEDAESEDVVGTPAEAETETVGGVLAEDAMVEVFKQSARSAPLVALAPVRPMWVKTYRPVRIKQMDSDQDDFDMEESAPQAVVMSPEMAMTGHVKPHHPRALDDMDLGWESGFQDHVFEADEKAEQQEDDGADHADYEDGGSVDHQDQRSEDADDHDDEQEQAASETIQDVGVEFGHPMLKGKGRAEKMLQRTRAGPSNTDHDEDSPALSAILATGGHVFAPPAPPAPYPAAFGVRDPDRMEEGRKAPVVVEFGHEVSGYKVTREREQKKWR